MILCWLVRWKKIESVDGRCFFVAKHYCCFNPSYILAVFSSTGTVPWYSWDGARVHFCSVSGWCFLFLSGSRQSTRFLWGRRFSPKRLSWEKPLLPLCTDGAADCVRILSVLSIQSLPFQRPCSLLMFLPVALDTFGFWELKCFNSTIVLGINTAVSGQGLGACGILMI